MIKLNETHPEVDRIFPEVRGSFTYQHGHYRSFTGIACDQTIEQTVNRHSKAPCGVIGFTLKPSASQRWTATHPERAAILQELKRITSLNSPMYDQYELSVKSWQEDEDMRTVMKAVINTRINPF